MKTALILTSILLSILLVGTASALIVVDTQWSDGSQTLTLTEGKDATFDVYLTTYDYPMDVSVKLYKSSDQLVKTFIDSTTEDYFFEHTYNTGSLSVGQYRVEVKGSDSKGASDIYILNLNVEEDVVPTPENNAPRITSTPNRVVDENKEYSYNVRATDTDNDVLTYSLTRNPNWLSIDSSTGLITGTAPQVNADLTYVIDVRVTDGKGGSATQSYMLTVKDVPVVTPTNNKPIITSTPVTQVNENTAYSYPVTGTDADGDSLTYSLTQAPSWLSINPSTGLVTGTAPSVDVDSLNVIRIRISDGKEFTEQTYILTVKNVPEGTQTNNAPVIISVPVTQINEGQTYSHRIRATDADEDTLTYSLLQNPNWLSINSQTGLITGTAPQVNANTDYTIRARVTDGEKSATQTYTLTVKNVANGEDPSTNQQPIASGQSLTTDKNKSLTVTLSASDVDGDSLVYSIFSNPRNGVLSGLNSVTGKITYTPNTNFVGSDSFTFRASDGKAGSNIATVSITVKETSITPGENRAPIITSTAVTQVNEEKTYAYQVTATDADGDKLTYSLTQSPSWVSINPQTGLIIGTAPQVSSSNVWQIIVRASDSKGAFATQTYNLIVKNIKEDDDDNGDSGKTIVLNSNPKKETSNLVDDFYQQKYMDQFNTISLDEEQVQPKTKEASIWGKVITAIVALLVLLLIIALVTILVRRL
ncbi:MAG: putative Ig domain-containing protein [Nanoarchaeota archaeon]|nr:putative Ig domain-containing protein [Nanoarchaeota archaeon]